MNNLLICGGSKELPVRSFVKAAMLKAWQQYGPFDFVVTGGAPNYDTVADSVAEELGWDRIILPANWVGRGKAAGHIRNSFMLKIGQPSLVLAFDGGPGTAGMKALSRKAGIKVLEAKVKK